MELEIDSEQVATARQLDAANHRWMILWSPHQRMFNAYAAFLPVRLMLACSDPHELQGCMRQIELRYTPPALPSRPPGSEGEPGGS